MFKPISIMAGKPKRIEALFSDGYLTVIVWTGSKYRLEGKSLEFDRVSELASHYKGEIKSMRELKGKVRE